MSAQSKTTPSFAEASILVAIAFGYFIIASIDAVASNFPTSGSFSDSSLTNLMLIELILGGLAFLFLHFCGYSIRELLPKPSLKGCVHGMLLCAVTLLAWSFIEPVFSYRSLEPEPIAIIASNARPSLMYLTALSVLNGLYEEFFLLGYLVRGFAAAGASIAIGLSVFIRLLYHLYQGPIGAISVVVVGVIFSLYYWRVRSLWPVAFAHILIDVIALA
ncbi:CPBP family intramembrane glutamic endopeptidase [Undibacterium flavidum]|uniref:CPBP family intramembrane metalloprotease n=1 Tax=Undibacterium flavidum TaxID=2762297 RepID=A0ABR6YG85_9BURK|nr:CPBP family intramembrane glutamic endopeptidase [Undibacterium flavidum]MBC3875547.1 CPBP family intramembrane metalloprotease [Undibacterium flavidum]